MLQVLWREEEAWQDGFDSMYLTLDVWFTTYLFADLAVCRAWTTA